MELLVVLVILGAGIAGLFVVYRRATRRTGRRLAAARQAHQQALEQLAVRRPGLRLVAPDGGEGWAALEGTLDGTWLRLSAGAELAMIAGTTEMMRSPTVPGAADVVGLGAVIEGRADWKALGAALEAGYASGDSNPFDADFGSFSFNADHKVGLVMFEEFLGAVSAVQAANVSEPVYAAAPPRGFDQLPSDGAVTNAVYLFPRLSAQPFEFIDLLGGFLVAWGARPLVDPMQSSVNGSSIGPFGGPAARLMGWEVDAAVRLKMSQASVKVFGILEGGYFDPGAAFANAKGDEPEPVSLLQARLQILW